MGCDEKERDSGLTDLIIFAHRIGDLDWARTEKTEMQRGAHQAGKLVSMLVIVFALKSSGKGNLTTEQVMPIKVIGLLRTYKNRKHTSDSEPCLVVSF